MRTLASYQVDFLPNKRNKSHHYLSIFSSQTFFLKWNSLNILRHPIMLIQEKSARKDFKISDFIILDYNNLMSTSGVCKISALIQTQHVCTQKITLCGTNRCDFFPWSWSPNCEALHYYQSGLHHKEKLLPQSKFKKNTQRKVELKSLSFYACCPV